MVGRLGRGFDTAGPSASLSGVGLVEAGMVGDQDIIGALDAALDAVVDPDHRDLLIDLADAGNGLTARSGGQP